MMGIYYIGIRYYINFNTFDDKYFKSINGYEMINPIYEVLIEVLSINTTINL